MLSAQLHFIRITIIHYATPMKYKVSFWAKTSYLYVWKKLIIFACENITIALLTTVHNKLYFCPSSLYIRTTKHETLHDLLVRCQKSFKSFPRLTNPKKFCASTIISLFFYFEHIFFCLLVSPYLLYFNKEWKKPSDFFHLTVPKISSKNMSGSNQ